MSDGATFGTSGVARKPTYNLRCRNIGNDSRTRSTVSSETSTVRTPGSSPRSASTTPIGCLKISRILTKVFRYPHAETGSLANNEFLSTNADYLGEP